MSTAKETVEPRGADAIMWLILLDAFGAELTTFMAWEIRAAQCYSGTRTRALRLSDWDTAWVSCAKVFFVGRVLVFVLAVALGCCVWAFLYNDRQTQFEV